MAGLSTKKIALLIAAAVMALLPLAWVGAANAQSFRSGDHTVVSADETVDSSVYMAGNTIDVAGTVNGDVFCAGQNINISGTVNGDVLCAGQNVRIGGTVNGDVRAAGQNVTINGRIDGNLSAAGQTVMLESAARIGGDVGLGGQEAEVNGDIGRDLAAGSSRITIGGSVGRNVQLSSEQTILGKDADIAGNLTYASNREIERQSGAQINGELVRHRPAQQDNGFGGADLIRLLVVFVAMLTLALVLVALFPRIYHKASVTGLERPGLVLLSGFGASIIVPVLIFVIAMTIIGLPLAILATLCWIIVCMLSGTFAAYTLGRRLLRGRTDNALQYMLAGGSVLLVVYYIPVIGWLVALLALWFGIGLIVWQLRSLPPRRYDLAAMVSNGDAGHEAKPVKAHGKSKPE